jgi:putative hydrolase of the HAD superfamily
MTVAQSVQSLNLIFDADDTLWDSNIHFLEAFDSFCDALRDAGLAIERAEIQAAVRRAELKRIQTHGYGRKPYMVALQDAVDELAPRDLELMQIALDRIGNHLVERH